MKKKFNDGFSFLLMKSGSTLEDFLASKDKCDAVQIPHDWTIPNVDSFYEDAFGCYVKNFSYNKTNDKARVFLRFDGVYMDCKVYLNGTLQGEWKYGYTSFVMDITQSLAEGDNELIVTVDFRCPNSRWYSGAGIYRNVWLIETADTYIPDGGVYIHTEPEQEFDLETDTIPDSWKIVVRTEICGSEPPQDCDVNVSFYDMNEVDITNKLELIENFVSKTDSLIEKQFRIKNPELWSIDRPFVYLARVELHDGLHNLLGENPIQSESKSPLQTETLTFGFKKVTLTTDKGLFLNGEHIKLHGVCEHHDFGCLGAVFTPEAWERKLDNLKAMGVNAIRMSHNPSDPQAYEICDRKGFLVVPEAFDMWEKPKTEFDYGRFFPEWHERDMERWIRDARNHVCVCMWSMGNEIYDTHEGERGREVCANLTALVHKFDPLGNGYATIGSNYIPWENTQKVADDIKLIGYNYAEYLYEEHHKKHPDWIIYGSEVCSIVFSRGVYHFPLAAGILSEDDLQCSALGNSSTSWGADSLEKCNYQDRDVPFSLGHFLWTGHDYIGEPTPYHTKNSYFGQIDTAGFPKDAFYIWQAAWRDVKEYPMVHVFPYWGFNPGQTIDVRIATNGVETELVVNGVSAGKKPAVNNVSNYSVVYEPGYIEAIAYDEMGCEIARERRDSFGDTDHLDQIDHVYGKYHFLEIQAVDKEGHPVENACDRVKVSVKGGTLLGLDNGDSTDYDSYKGDSRFLFRGKLLAVVREDSTLSDANHRDAVDITAEIVEVSPRIRDIQMQVVDDVTESDETAVIVSTSDSKDIHVVASVLPVGVNDRDIKFVLTDIHGNPSNLASIEARDTADGYDITIHPLGDGDFILRATANSGFDHVKVISTLQFRNEGLGQIYTNPYEFVSASTNTRTIGDVNNGNERGVATSRTGESMVVFDDVDFGKYGSEEITIPIFALTNDRYEMEIWKGVPGEEGAVLLNNDGYCKPSIWNTYQEETYSLSSRLTGIQTISLRLWEKVHIKGFICKEVDPLREEMWAAEAVSVYGDQFVKQEKCVEQIGNNVTIDYGMVDMGTDISRITIFGHDRNGINTLHVRLAKEDETAKAVIEFMPSGDEYSEQSFDIKGFEGTGNLTVIFLPGCDFDLGWIKFS